MHGDLAHPVFEGTLCRRHMMELQSQEIHQLALSCKGLVKVRTMWSTVDPLQAPLDVNPEIQGSLELNRLVEESIVDPLRLIV